MGSDIKKAKKTHRINKGEILYWLKHFNNLRFEDMSDYAKKNNIKYEILYYKYRVLICANPTIPERHLRLTTLAKEYMEDNEITKCEEFAKLHGVGASTLSLYIQYVKTQPVVKELIKKHNLTIHFPEFLKQGEEKETSMKFSEVVKKPESKPSVEEIKPEKLNQQEDKKTTSIVTSCGLEITMPRNITNEKILKIFEFVRSL